MADSSDFRAIWRPEQGDNIVDKNVLSQCLGEDFKRMPAIVQRAHQGRIRLSGTVAVERGTGICALVAAVMKLPITSRQCTMTVSGEHFPDRMSWRRSFAGRKLESNFVKEGDYLVEFMGPIRLRLKPEFSDGCLSYRLVDARLGPVKLPQWLMPRLTAWERERNGRYEFDVDIRLPLLGRLVRYGGLMSLEAE